MFLTSSHAADAAAAGLSFGNHCPKEHTVQTMTYGCLILDFRYQGGVRAAGRVEKVQSKRRNCDSVLGIHRVQE